MYSEAVVKAFKKFDTNGDGSISREELGTVLKSLQPDAWDQESVDQLLSQADTSGDGKLFIEEFVNWAFAEGKDLKAEAAGGFSFIVSGCSREELNGEYLKQEKFYGNRPVFYCAENKRVLFYEKTSQNWKIFWKTCNKASATVKTERAPHMLSEGQVWKVSWLCSSLDFPALVGQSSGLFLPLASSKRQAGLEYTTQGLPIEPPCTKHPHETFVQNAGTHPALTHKACMKLWKTIEPKTHRQGLHRHLELFSIFCPKIALILVLISGSERNKSWIWESFHISDISDVSKTQGLEASGWERCLCGWARDELQVASGSHRWRAHGWSTWSFVGEHHTVRWRGLAESAEENRWYLGRTSRVLGWRGKLFLQILEAE